MQLKRKSLCAAFFIGLCASLLVAQPARAGLMDTVNDLWNTAKGWFMDEPPPPPPPPPARPQQQTPPVQAPPAQAAAPAQAASAPPVAAPPQDFREVLSAAPPIPEEAQLGVALERQKQRTELLRAEGALQNSILALLTTEARIRTTLDENQDERLQDRAADLQDYWTYWPVPRENVRSKRRRATTTDEEGEAGASAAPSCDCLNARVHWIGNQLQAGEAVLSFPDLELDETHQVIRSQQMFEGCHAEVDGDARFTFGRQEQRGLVVLSCEGEAASFTLGRKIS